jgi:hypothetical protein
MIDLWEHEIVLPDRVAIVSGLVDSLEPRGVKVEVVLSARGLAAAEKIAADRNANAAKHRRKLKYGFTQDGDRVGAYGELAVALITVLLLLVVPADLGQRKSLAGDVGNLQVRATTNVEAWAPIYPDDPADAAYVAVTAQPPSPVIIVHGWVWGWEAKARPLVNLGQGKAPFHPSYPRFHHPLIELMKVGGDSNHIWLYANAAESVGHTSMFEH